ncbi:MAG: ATP-binding cassette domain-containing protein [Bacteroidia bacterium]
MKTRLDELYRLAEEQDLSRLSRRILDFFADHPSAPALRNDAIQLRARYNEFAAHEQAEQNPTERAEMMQNAHDLLSSLAGELSDQLAQDGKGTDKSMVPSQEPDLVFSGRGITKTFVSPKFVFNLPDLDLDLQLGEITGIVGENGNGKTTLLRIVAGDLEISGGNISYPAFDVAASDWYRIKQNIAFIPQALKPWKGFLKENLHFTAAIHGIRGVENEEQVDFIIHRLGLTQYEDALWSEISSGYKLRFELARALVWNPALLIIDEPLANLDINTQEVFLQDLRYLASSTQNPISILLSSQHLHEVESVADNIIFIKNGEALYNGRMNEFGQDREENLFELTTSATKGDIQSALEHIENISVEDRGRTKIIRTPVDMASNQLLGELVKQDIAVDYFRDISTSTLKLFREND